MNKMTYILHSETHQICEEKQHGLLMQDHVRWYRIICHTKIQ